MRALALSLAAHKSLILRKIPGFGRPLRKISAASAPAPDKKGIAVQLSPFLGPQALWAHGAPYGAALTPRAHSVSTTRAALLAVDQGVDKRLDLKLAQVFDLLANADITDWDMVVVR